MNTSKQTEFLKFLKLLNDNDIIEDVILVGSWAEFLYFKNGILPAENADEFKTLDIDFLLENLRKPTPPKNLLALAKSEGYLIESDILTGTTKLLGERLEIEFLISKRGAGFENTLKTNLGVTAQALRHLEMLLEYPVTTKYLCYDVTIPLPEAYVVHKMIINPERGSKSRKDIRAIENLIPYLDIEKITEITQKLHKKDLRRVEQFIQENSLIKEYFL